MPSHRPSDFAAARHTMVRQLRNRGIRDERLLDAMGHIPRDLFVPEELRHSAYDDRALPITSGQTISQPYMVATMTQELSLTGTEAVLEIGTGSGYQAAVLAALCRRVVTLERLSELTQTARERLDALGITNVAFHVADGSVGWQADAPYDAIVVTAGSPRVPPQLLEQLADGGRLVIPVGPGPVVTLQRIVRRGDSFEIADVCDCSFVPLIGEAGWAEPS
ncbi:MAG: protein-L-isoaspartate(D-aspartate) O-methyltransferase [Planctomycetales bacterium]|nr:protein-L-isoaspartate(D-aspartate) O-methyltransferase [Planctomycetales bacterium]